MEFSFADIILYIEGTILISLAIIMMIKLNKLLNMTLDRNYQDKNVLNIIEMKEMNILNRSEYEELLNKYKRVNLKTNYISLKENLRELKEEEVIDKNKYFNASLELENKFKKTL
ncbi:hypothetical protein [Oceanirhabdus sp. W0125-5]|uniref:hypothetical protein n=1 Tax=Oceanirhabdus sp. W0125-5 TaxID=2999116 RepID=UPI0022F2E698|nr:hypothetical protein [Oceanirhabdus sp. W0125-5]WBW99252.1 hypothetical protein OW730_11020 [Oceanirhabdus sp. W0125-5]